MKHLIIILLLSVVVHSQSISKQVIGTAGKSQTNSNLKVSWTIGEPIAGFMTAGGYQLGNGYYPSKHINTLDNEDNILDIPIKIFPNPTSQMIHVSHPNLNSFVVSIMDSNGKQLYFGTLNKEEPLDISKYTQGIYLITVENKTNNKKNTYKIIKK